MSTERGRIRPLFPVLAALCAAIAAIAALRRLDAVQVEGSSMAPTLLPGDRLIIESWTFARRPPRPGEVVLAPDPRGGRELIKRIATMRDGLLDLRGDLPGSSTDSRQFGSVPAASVRWRVASRYWPPARFGPVPLPRMPLALDPRGGEPACTAFGDLVAGAEEGR